MIYVGDKKATPYYEDYKPVNVYRNNVKIAGWRVDEKSGTSIEWADTYNDKIVSAVVSGASTQVVTVQGKNLYPLSSVNWKIYVSISAGEIRLSPGTYTASLQSVVGATSWRFCFKVFKNGVVITEPDTLHPVHFVLSSRNFYYSDTGFFYWWSSNSAYLTDTFTIDDTYTVAWFLYAGNTTNATVGNQPMIEPGPTATPYEPFTPNSPSPDYPSPIISTGEVSGIDLTVTGNAGQSYQVHQNIILRSLPDGTCDTWDAVTGTVTRNVGVKVMNGTENILLFRNDANKTCVYFALPNGCNHNVTTAQAYCSHWKVWNYTLATQLTGGEAFVLASTTNYIYFSMFSSHLSAPTAAGFKAWLAAQYAAGTPVTVLYKLTEPTIEQIDPIPLPTYPHYTALSCSESVTAKARVKVME